MLSSSHDTDPPIDFHLPSGEEIDLDFQVVPHAGASAADGAPGWRVILVPVSLSAPPLALDLRGDVVLGSNDESPGEDPDVNLAVWQGYQQGVSRRHLMLRPGPSKLFVMDLRSTNGTQINGLPLGVGWAYALQDGDLISMGRLHLRVHIVERPAP